jgi:mono/diheme cytochrome c family protein
MRVVVRGLRGAAMLGVAAACGVVLVAEKAPESYSAAMKTLGATAQNLRKDAAASPKDYEALAKEAAAMKGAYATAVTFWTEKKVEDALQIATNGAKAAADLEAAVKAKDDAAIATAGAAATGTCAGCHMAHRVRNDDGTYEIK